VVLLYVDIYQRVLRENLVEPALNEAFSTWAKTKLSKIEQLKLLIEAWGLNPNEILSNEALSMPHRTVVDTMQAEINILNQALKQAIVKELKQS